MVCPQHLSKSIFAMVGVGNFPYKLVILIYPNYPYLSIKKAPLGLIKNVYQIDNK